MGVWRALDLKILLSIEVGMDVYFTPNSAILICSEGELLIYHSQKDSTQDFDGFSNFPNLGFKL